MGVKRKAGLYSDMALVGADLAGARPEHLQVFGVADRKADGRHGLYRHRIRGDPSGSGQQRVISAKSTPIRKSKGI